MTPTLTLHQGDAQAEFSETPAKAARIALLGFRDTLAPDDYLRPAVDGVLRCIEYRIRQSKGGEA
jgi:hypothetical protein